MDTEGIDELLNDEPVETPEAAEQPQEEPKEPEPQEAEGQPRAPDGKFASKEKGEAEQPKVDAPPASEDEPNVPRAALMDERRKRQELEQQVAAMQQQFQQQPKEQEAPPGFWDDPDRAIDHRVQGAVQQAISAFQQQQQMERINASEAAAKAKYTDYGDAFSAFQQAAAARPALVQQMMSSPDPAEFAYTTGKRSMDLERVGSIDELLKAERAKWEAELKAAAPKTFPSTTATDGSAASRSGPAWSGPPSMNELLS